MADEAVLEGLVVSITERAYGAWRDESGRDMPGGVTRTLWLYTGPGGAPVDVRVGNDPALIEACSGLEFGQAVRARCAFFGTRQGRIRRVLRTLESATARAS